MLNIELTLSSGNVFIVKTRDGRIDIKFKTTPYGEAVPVMVTPGEALLLATALETISEEAMK